MLQSFWQILRSIAKQLYYKEFLEGISDDLDHILKDVLHQLFKEAKTIKNQLSLDTNELLSTIILGIVDEVHAKASFLAVGDGLIYYDGQTVEYEQDNKPDYLGYHLGENFESWFSKQSNYYQSPTSKTYQSALMAFLRFRTLRIRRINCLKDISSILC